jgi:hypothetical protein
MNRDEGLAVIDVVLFDEALSIIDSLLFDEALSISSLLKDNGNKTEP